MKVLSHTDPNNHCGCFKCKRTEGSNQRLSFQYLIDFIFMWNLDDGFFVSEFRFTQHALPPSPPTSQNPNPGPFPCVHRQATDENSCSHSNISWPFKSCDPCYFLTNNQPQTNVRHCWALGIYAQPSFGMAKAVNFLLQCLHVNGPFSHWLPSTGHTRLVKSKLTKY